MNRVIIMMLGAMVFVSPKGPCPMRGGVCQLPNPNKQFWGCGPGPSLRVMGTDSIVMSATDGVVQAVFNVGDQRAVMIRNHGFFYTYSELDSVFLIKNQLVKAGDVMGYSSSREIEFTAADTNVKFVQHLERLVTCSCKIMR